MLLTIGSFLSVAFVETDLQAKSASRCRAGEAQLIARATPDTAGPLRLERVHCLNMPSSHYTVSAPQPSPDGSRYFIYDGVSGLWVGMVDSDAKASNLSGAVTGAGLGLSGDLPFAWSNTPAMLFGARQETAKPSGFALGPLALVSVSPTGATALPPLAARRLDVIRWVGEAGLAIAAFDTRGSYYRPERENKDPALAIIDGRRGKILQLLAMPEIGKFMTRISVADARIERGRVHALYRIGKDAWFEWRQGNAPARVALEGVKRASAFALAPDGKNVLVTRGLSAGGMICEHDPNCPPPIPHSGPIAELRDIRSGALRWAITGTANSFSSDEKPAISPDGRYALISLPYEGARRPIALVSMRDGRVVQTLGAPWTGHYAMGFAADGRSAWTSGSAYLVRYTLRHED